MSFSSGYRFGKRSQEQIDTCHADIQLINQIAISQCPVDYAVHQGARTVAEQQEYFNKGASSINPKKYASLEALAAVAKHIVIPGHPFYSKSRAFDIHIAEKYNGKPLSWCQMHLSFVAAYLIRVSHELNNQGKISHVLRWGGDWNKDGVIALDHKLVDMPHLEIVKPDDSVING